jgi:hypothetical protein
MSCIMPGVLRESGTGIAMEQWMIVIGSKKMERRVCRSASWPFCRNAKAAAEIGKRNDG